MSPPPNSDARLSPAPTQNTSRPSACRSTEVHEHGGQVLWRSGPGAVSTHDLPGHRGEEVTAEVLDGPRSITFRQAATRTRGAMAVLDGATPGPAGPPGIRRRALFRKPLTAVNPPMPTTRRPAR
ncbi:hypothetical protein [Streptomyces sp. NPDC050535]|uniref:hypothetical protein n=1 Tax=Streptomyces sp. NPDC050535 TaxID=3365626 RepID=UPI00379B9F09